MAITDHLIRAIGLSRNEWCAVLDANNGVTQYIGDGMMAATLIWANVHDTPGLGSKWSVDQAALVRKLQSLDMSVAISIQEACDRFWSRAALPTDDALRASGILPPIKPEMPRQ